MNPKQLLFLIAAITTGTATHANWSLDYTASSLSFVSVKAIDIAEVHRFTELAGEITDKGDAVLEVKLSSVDTAIPIRDERMQELLFETARHPLATARTRIDKDLIDGLGIGISKAVNLEVMLDLHGERISIDAHVIVTRVTESRLTVFSAQPLILNAADANLTEGIEALRKVANLPSIGGAVPVTFVLTFLQED